MAGKAVRDGGRPPVRWSADTETAFLLALRQTGSAKAAAQAIGRSVRGAIHRRKRLPAFAARWEAVLDALMDERREADQALRMAGGAVSPDGHGGIIDSRTRYDGLTPLRQRAFLRALTDTGSYEAACRAVRITANAVRAMRTKHPAFQAACERALERSAGTLEQVAYERAVEGWDEPIVHAGKIVGQRPRYSEPLLRLLLQREAARDAVAAAERAGMAAGGKTPTPRGLIRKPAMTSQEVDAALTRKLDAIERRQKAEERQRGLAWADEMRRRGLAP